MIDGRIVPPEQATVSVFDRGFLYGDSVFETIATRGGKAVDLEAHVARLAGSAARVYIPMPVDAEVIEREVRLAIEESRFPESTIRLILTRGSSALGLEPALAESPLRVVLVLPQKRPAPELYERGIAVVTFRTQRVAESTEAVGAKVGNYLVAVLAMREASARRAQEALILDAHGRVVEGASSNVFIVEEDRLLTPPEEAGILLGITRQRILEIAHDLGISLTLCELPLERVMKAKEVFISSSVREILSVVRIDDVPIGTGQPGPIAQLLLREYQRRASAAAG